MEGGGSPTTSARKGTLQLFRKQEQLDGTAKDIAILERFGVALASCWTSRAASGPSRRCGWSRRSSRAAYGCSATRPATASSSRTSLAAVCRQLGVEFRYRTLIEASRPRAAGSTGVATDKGTLTGDAYIVALGSYSPLASAPHRHRPAGLPGEGLLDHRPDHRSRGRPGIHDHGRDPQGGDHAPGRSHPGRRHGRARRLQHKAARPAAAQRSSMWSPTSTQGRRRRRKQASGAGCDR